MEPISQDFLKSKALAVDDDGFFLGVSIELPELAVRSPIEAPEAPIEIAEAAEAIALPPLPTIAPSIAIPDRMYFRIGDVADLAGVKPYVLRYWESEFSMISPEKSATGQRVYRRSDVETILLIKHLLYNEKYSIDGARKRIQELRRDGQLRAFKQDKVHGGQEAAILRDRLKQVCELAEELETLAQLPMRELFKF